MVSQARRLHKLLIWTIFAALGCFCWSRATLSSFISGRDSLLLIPRSTGRKRIRYCSNKRFIQRNHATKPAMKPSCLASFHSSDSEPAGSATNEVAAAAACVGVAALTAEQVAARQKAASLRREAEELRQSLAADRKAARKCDFNKFQALSGTLDSKAISAQQLAIHAKEVWSVEMSTDLANNLIKKYGQDNGDSLSFEEFCVAHENLEICKSQFESAKHEAELAIERARVGRIRQQLENRRITKWMSTLSVPQNWRSTTLFTGLIVAAYLLPAMDTFRFFLPVELMGGSEFVATSIFIQPLVLWATASLAIDETLPQSLSFNLNQALLLDMVLMVVRALFMIVPYFLVSAFKAVGLPGAQLYLGSTFLSSLNSLTFIASLSCIVYSLASTIWNEFPDQIPYISESARKRTHNPDEFWIFPAPAWFPSLGLTGFYIAAVEYVFFLLPWFQLYHP